MIAFHVSHVPRRSPWTTVGVGIIVLAATGCGRRPALVREAYRGEDLVAAESLLHRRPAPDVDIFGYPVDHLDRRVLLRLLADAEYDSIETILAARWQAVQGDIREEGRLYHTFEAFGRGLPDLGPRLNAWIQQRPTSGHAHLAKAYYMLARAQESRGAATSFRTPRNQMQNMGQFVELAFREAQAGMVRLPDHLIGYQVLLSALGLYGSTAEGYDDLVAYALSAHPTSFLLRRTIMHSLTPRWGGSYPEMAAFAEDAAQYADRNPRLRALADFANADQARTRRFDRDYDGAVGLLHTLGDGGYEYGIALDAADIYIAKGEYLTALGFVGIAEAQLPQGRSMLESKGKALLWAAHLLPPPLRDSAFALSIETFSLLQELSPPQVDATAWLAFARTHRAECGERPAPCSFE